MLYLQQKNPRKRILRLRGFQFIFPYASGLAVETVLAVILCKRDNEPRSGDIISCAIILSTAVCNSCGAMFGSTLFTLKLLRVPVLVVNIN